MPIFRVKSVKIYTGQKNLHWRHQQQLSGMWGGWVTGADGFNYDCLGHQELKKIAHDGRRVFIEFVSQDGWPDHTPTVSTTRAPVVLKRKQIAQPTRSLFTLRMSWKSSSGWLQLVFHIGSENREEQLKIHPVQLYTMLRLKNCQSCWLLTIFHKSD